MNRMSFQKVGASKIPFIEGTQASVRSQQLLTSTGIGALDALLGGGLPVGAIVAIGSLTIDIVSTLIYIT